MTPPPAPRPSPALAVVCWAVILGVVAAIGIGNQWRERRTTAAAPTSAAATGPGLDVLLAGRYAVFLAGRASTTGPLRQQVATAVVQLAVRPVDRLAAVTITRELLGPAAALRQLRADAAAVATVDSSPLRADATALGKLYAADAGPLSDAERAGLAHDLGYFGRLAVTQGPAPDPAARRAVLGEAARTSITGIAAGVGVAVAFFAGFVGLAVLVILFGLGTLRPAYVPPPAATARPVWLETFAVWLVAFVGFGAAAGRLPVRLPTVATETILAGLTAAVAVGWPAWRGKLGWAEVRRTLGWHAGRGVAVEAAWGLAGYVAGLPVVAVGLLLTGLIVRLSRAHPSHPIQQDLGERMSTPHVLSLLFTAAVLAPLLEETVFRGALYAHLRRRHAAWISAGVVAVLFAAVHPQGWALIPTLGGIALVLAALREWRGSLIAPMVAHAVHNGTLVGVLAIALG